MNYRNYLNYCLSCTFIEWKMGLSVLACCTRSIAGYYYCVKFALYYVVLTDFWQAELLLVIVPVLIYFSKFLMCVCLCMPMYVCCPLHHSVNSHTSTAPKLTLGWSPAQNELIYKFKLCSWHSNW